MNYPGHSYQISTNYGESLTSYNDYTKIDSYTIFQIDSGKLTISGHPDGGSLTLTTNQNGRAFDVNREGTNSASTLEMKSGVHVYNCGFSVEKVAKSNNGGAVYVRDKGTFIMSGGLMSSNRAGAGGAVYVASGGEFTMNGGAITNNFALNTDKYGGHDQWGGGVWVAGSGEFNWNVGEINGNTASSAPEGNLNYHEVYPNYNPPSTTPSTPPTPSNPEPPVTNYPIYVVPAGSTEEFGYDTIKEAYDTTSATESEFTIYIKQLDFYQTYIEEKDGNSFKIYPDAATIDDGKSVILKPYGNSESESITLNIINQMFSISSGGSLTISGNDNAQITVSGTFSEGTVDGGFVYVNGGSLTVLDGVTISDVKANNGGAIYLDSGNCTLEGGVIQNCAASEAGDAVYVVGGIFTVKNDAKVASSNDVYLSSGQVIYAGPDYTGSVEMITLPSYAEGTEVVNTGSDDSGYSRQFALNQDGNEGIERVLELKSGTPNYLVVRNIVEYEVIIPPTLVISEEGDTGSMEISVSGLRIPSSSALAVYVNSDFTLEYELSQETTLSYQLINGDGTYLSSDSLVGRFTMSNQNPILLTATVLDRASYSGQYTDTVTFTYGLETIA